jgi:iron complex outermembrane receptor protein
VLPNGQYTRHLGGDWSATTGNAGLEWTPADKTLLYLKYSRGYKSGGLVTGSIVANPFTDSEYVDAYELGAKQDVLDNLQVNTAVFYSDYQDAQIPLTIPNPAGTGPGVGQTFNLPIINKGVEIETIYRPFDPLTLLLNYAYLDARLKTSSNCADGQAYQDNLDSFKVGPNVCANYPPSGRIYYHTIANNHVPGSPKNKLAFNATYVLNFEPGNLALSGSYTWRDEQYSSIFTREEYIAPAYGQVDLRVTWTNAGNDFSIVGYVRNLLDDEGYEYVTAAASASGITQQYSLTPPQTYGMQVQYRFGAHK